MRTEGTEDERRGWKREKRSWIFYEEEIASNPNIESGTIEGNIFILDCETARLSIWSEKWNTFIEVGINSLLKKENFERKIGKITAATDITVFYKGIKLHKRSVKGDAGILEVIDIKGELQKDYINISRGSFTKKGEQFFEGELYPGLLEAVRKVLKGLARCTPKREDASGIENFDEKIVRVIREKCGDFLSASKIEERREREKERARIRKELISLIVSVSVLAYFARRDEWNITEKLSLEEDKEDIWVGLIAKIDEILSEQKNESIANELSKTTKFFNIKVYGEDTRESINDASHATFKNKYRFTQLFLNTNHWAILQTRKDMFSSWMSYLILLGEDGKSVEFQKLITFPHSEQDSVLLEQWGQKLCRNNDRKEDQEDSTQQFLLNWMLQNIPTVGMFCNADGNIRVNVLSSRIYPSIFLNKNFKYLILERIMERAEKEGIQRFSTITWQGREYLGCKDLPFNISFVKRGYPSDWSYHKCIVPFDGTLLQKCHEVILEESETEIKIKRLLERMDIHNYLMELETSEVEAHADIRAFLREMDREDQLLNLTIAISEVLLAQMSEQNFEPKYSIKDLLGEYYEDLMLGIEIYTEFVRLAMKPSQKSREQERQKEQKAGEEQIEELQQTSILENELQGEKFSMLCSAWLYFCRMPEMVLQMTSRVEMLYKGEVESKKKRPIYEKKREKLVDYLMDCIPYRLEREQVKHYVELYEAEILELCLEMERKKLRQYLEEFQINNHYVFQRLEKQRKKRTEEKVESRTEEKEDNANEL